MKLLPVKKRKVAVLFTSGLGDTLLYVPLLKELKRKQFTITCIFFSKFDNDCLFETGLADTKKTINSKLSFLFFAVTRLRYFSNIYINHFGKGNIISLCSFLCSKKISKTGKGITGKGIKAIIPEFTDAEQNLHLLYSKYNSVIRNTAAFYLPEPGIETILLPGTKPYFIIQFSAGNNNTPFKNWPLKNWLIVIGQLCRRYPAFEFIITGDHSETGYIRDFENLNCSNCKVLIGKTSVKEIFGLTAKSCGYVGLDSGIMHMAVALQKKTLTIFGASNERLYGYEFLDPVNHKVIASKISCRPCSSWKNANTTRVTDPMQCPDFACLASIEPDLVLQQIIDHFKLY